MSLFLATHRNKLDRKGRISVPAQFRTALAGESFQGIVLFRSHKHPCLEGCSWSRMEQLSASLDQVEMFSDEQDYLATTIFADSTPLPFDGDGRIVLPRELADFAGIGDTAAFVGRGRTFQVWEPGAFETWRQEAAARARETGATLKLSAAAPSPAPSPVPPVGGAA